MSAVSGKSILLLVHNPGNAKVMEAAVTSAGMNAIHVDSAATLTEVLCGTESTMAALVDVSGFGQDVWELCSQLHKHRIPFVVLSPARDELANGRSLEFGAASVLHKPVAKAALLKLLQTLGDSGHVQ
ncbi:MAG: response regulator [Pseudohongiellaceae bacterium]